MSDLRTRIEWALFDACCRFDVPDGERRDMADAVIAELERQPPGLQPDGSFIDGAGTVWRHNGTEWINDPDYRP